MFQECINPRLIPILNELVERGILTDRKFYLAGGTALAIQLGHRLSVDLDFFSVADFNPQNLLMTLNKSWDEIVIRNMSSGTLNALINRDYSPNAKKVPYS